MRRAHNTRGKIVSAAWRLFYDQGYDDTTVEDILAASGVARGTFYHYFEGKDALLAALSQLFDDKYDQLRAALDPEADAFDQLIFLNQELFAFIDASVSPELLARLYSTQLTTRGEKHLMDRSRVYYKLLRQLVRDGQEKGQLVRTLTVNELVNLYAMCERALIYDWCVSGGDYSLRAHSARVLPLLLGGVREKP